MSKARAIKFFLMGLLMTAISVWTATRGLKFGWLGIVFFGSGTLLFVIKFFRPDFKWIKDINSNSEEFKEQTKQEFEKIYNDNGIFTFNDNGFHIKTNKGVQEIQWTEVKSMVGYKEVRYATDCICLDVFCDQNRNFKITEETPGWFRFLDRSKKAYPSIDKSWEIEISTPVFDTKLTLVYDREIRILKAVTSEHYTT